MKLQKLLLCALPLVMLLSGCGKSDAEKNEGGMTQDGTSGLVYRSVSYSKENGEVEEGYSVAGYYGEAKEVKTGDMFNGKPVIAIEEYAFRNNLTIESFEIGKNIAHIGAYAFCRTYNMTTVSVEKGNKTFKVENGLVYQVEKEDGAESSTLYFGEADKYYSFDAIEQGFSYLKPGCLGNFKNLGNLRVNLVQMPKYSSGKKFSVSSLFNGANWPLSGNSYYKDEMANNYVPNLSSLWVEGMAGQSVIPENFCNNLYTLNHLYIGAGITGIEKNAFYNCRLHEIQIMSDEITTIADQAFQGNKDLYKVWVQKQSGITFGDMVFYDTTVDFRVYFAGAIGAHTMTNNTMVLNQGGSKGNTYGSQDITAFQNYCPTFAFAGIPADPGELD